MKNKGKGHRQKDRGKRGKSINKIYQKCKESKERQKDICRGRKDIE